MLVAGPGTLGEIQEAEEWLQKGREIVVTLNSDYNKAEVERLHGRILWARSWRDGQAPQKCRELILQSFRTAQHLLLSAGFPIEEIESEINRVRRGERPHWLRA